MKFINFKYAFQIINKRILKCLISLLILLIITISAEAKSNTGKAGDVLSFVIPATAYGLSLRMDNSEGRGQFYKSLFSTLGITYAGKIASDKDGPDSHNYTFPSEHTSIAFSGAAFMQRRYGWQYGIPSYTAASFVGWSRIHTNHNDIDDVMAGAVIGISSAYYFTKPSQGLQLDPIVENGITGLLFKQSW